MNFEKEAHKSGIVIEWGKHQKRKNITFKVREQFFGYELSLIYPSLLLLNCSGTQSISYRSTISTTYKSYII